MKHRSIIPVKEITFYQEHGYIIFEDLISSIEQKIMFQEAKSIIVGDDFADRYTSGFDLWRRSAVFKKIAFKRDFYQIIHQLTEVKPLGIAFDHWISNADGLKDLPYLEEKCALQDVTPYQGLATLMIFNFGQTSIEGLLDIEFPIGSCLFIEPKFRLSWNRHFLNASNCFYVIGVSQKETVFTASKTTPLSLVVEQTAGYSIGDPLTRDKNPFLFK